MINIENSLSALVILAGFALTSLVGGCATSTIGSNVEGNFLVPQIVSSPENVPAELQPYVSRFEEMLIFRGFKLGSTKDPQAFQFYLELAGEPTRATVTAYLTQNGKTLLMASAIDKSAVDWHSVDESTKDALIKRLADNAINQFDQQLGKFAKQIQIVKAPGSDSDQTLVESGFTAFGTAFAVKSQNTFLTARHVIVGARQIVLFCGEGNSGPATLESNDAGNDLAVLRSDVKAKAFLELAPEDSLTQGDRVFTMGFPVPNFLGIQPKYTDGVVSSLSGIGDSKNTIEITVPIQPGNSGGPLVDSHGLVVGVITSTAALPYFYRHTGTVPQNVNFAVPSYYAYPLVKGLQSADASYMISMTPQDRVNDSVCLVAIKAGELLK